MKLKLTVGGVNFLLDPAQMDAIVNVLINAAFIEPKWISQSSEYLNLLRENKVPTVSTEVVADAQIEAMRYVTAQQEEQGK
jgi:hypothetical protein